MAESTAPLEAPYFHTDGAIPYGARCYVERPADQQLRERVGRGELCYVLTASQMGKTSLIVHALNDLRTRGVPAAYIDLHRFGTHVDADVWCRSVLNAVCRQLNIEANVPAWWAERSGFAPMDNFVSFLQEVVCAAAPGPVALFIDEIGTVLGLDFGDAFITAIRSMVQSRALQPDRNRIAFVLIGMVPPDQLIRDHQTAHFNIGRQITLDRLILDEARVLEAGLPQPAGEILERVFYWTAGHPYLTQRICQVVAQSGAQSGAQSSAQSSAAAMGDPVIDQLVRETLLSDQAREMDPNLTYVRKAILTSTDRDALLRLYRQIVTGRRVKYVEQSPAHRELTFCGLATVDDAGRLAVSNRIYETVFDINWIRDNDTQKWWQAVPRYAWAAAGVIVLLMLGLALAFAGAMRNARLAEQNLDLALSRQLTSQSTMLLNTQYDLALLLALEAERISDIPETRDALSYALATNPQLTGYLRGHEAPITALAFGANGRLLAAGDADGAIRLWDSQSRQPLPVAPEGHQQAISGLAFSHDGSLLVSASCAAIDEDGQTCARGEIGIWTLDPERIAGTIYSAHAGELRALALNADDSLLATMTDRELFIWNMSDMTVRQRAEQTGDETLTAAAFSPTDPNLLVYSTNTGKVRLLDAQKLQPEGEFAPATRMDVSSLAFRADGRVLAVANRDGGILLWDAASWEPLGEGRRGHVGAVIDIEFASDGSLISSGSDGQLLVWDLPTRPTPVLSLVGQGGSLQALAAAAAGESRAVATNGPDNSIILWDLDGDPQRGRLLSGHEGGTTGISFSPDGSVLASAGVDRTVAFWNVAGGALLGRFAAPGDSAVRRVVFDPTGTTVAIGETGGLVALLDLADPTADFRPLGQHTRRVRDLAFSPDGRRLVSGDDAGLIYVWDRQTGGLETEPLDGHRGREVFAVEFSPDGRLLASGSWDGAVRIWDVDTWLPLGDPIVTGMAEVWDVKFSPDGRTLAVSGSRNAVSMIDVESRKPADSVLTNHRNQIQAIAFSADGQLLATGGRDKNVATWNVTGRRVVGPPLQTHTAEVYDVAFSPDGRVLAAADLAGPILISAVDYDDLTMAVCRVVERNLTAQEWAQYVGQSRQYATVCP